MQEIHKDKDSGFVTPILGNFNDLYQDILGKHPIMVTGDLGISSLEAARKELEEKLKSIFSKTQRLNEKWADERFKLLWKAPESWSRDGILVDSEGRMDRNMPTWSTLGTYMANSELPLKMDDLIKRMQEKGSLLFPITPPKDSIHFWFKQHEQEIKSTIEHQIRENLEIVDYPVHPEVASSLPDVLRMARIKRNKVGTTKFANGQIILGKLGFWERTNLNAKYALDIRYAPRIEIDESTPLGHLAYISPFSEEFVLLTGGLPMDEKHGNVKEIIRANQQATWKDFIAASAIAFLDKHGDMPFVFRYNPYRPWLGEYPQHR